MIYERLVLKCHGCNEEDLARGWVSGTQRRWICHLEYRQCTNDEQNDLEYLYAAAKRHFTLEGHDYFTITKEKGTHCEQGIQQPPTFEIVKEICLPERIQVEVPMREGSG